jgi:DNA-binding NarL/FixJ family response regulator
MRDDGVTPSTTRIVVADDHTLFRLGLAELICTDPAFRVIAHAATGSEVLTEVVRHRPAILILDVAMPGPGAEKLIGDVLAISPETSIVIVTMYEDPALVSRLLERGAAAFLVKDIGREDLLAALHAVIERPNHVTVSVSRTTLSQLNSGSAAGSPLTRREIEVLKLVAQAYTNAQIALRLGIAEGTVKRHLTNIFAKLQATSRLDALRKAASAAGLDITGMDP